MCWLFSKPRVIQKVLILGNPAAHCDVLILILMLLIIYSWKLKKFPVDSHLIRRIVINPDCLWTQASQSSLLALSDSGVLEGSIRITTLVPLATFGLVPKTKSGRVWSKKKFNSRYFGKVNNKNVIFQNFEIFMDLSGLKDLQWRIDIVISDNWI